MWTASSDFCKIDNTFLNITVGMEDQLPNCPIFLLKIQFYPLSDQQITPSLRLTPEQISSLCCYPLCAAAGYSSSSSFSFFFFFFFSIFILFYFICLIYLIWEKSFEGRVFDQQNTKQHWSATKNHQVLSQSLKYLLKNIFQSQLLN